MGNLHKVNWNVAIISGFTPYWIKSTLWSNPCCNRWHEQSAFYARDGIRRKSKIEEDIEKYSIIRAKAAIDNAHVCILVIDATDDETVESGGAEYVYGGTQWIKISELKDATIENNKEYLGTVQKVLVEGPSKNNDKMLTGRTNSNKVVVFEGAEELIGQVIDLKII